MSCYRLRQPVDIIARYVAPPGHNRLKDVEVAINLLPSADTIPFESDQKTHLRDYYVSVSEGLIERLRGNEPIPITGFSVQSIEFRLIDFDWLVQTACFRAGVAAADILIELVRSNPAIVDLHDLN